MCDDPLCQLTQEQLRRENKRLREKAEQAYKLQFRLRQVVAVLNKRDGVDAGAVLREAFDGQ